MKTGFAIMLLYKGILLFILTAPGNVAPLSCYSCSNAESLDSCKSITTCGSTQSCFTKLQKKGQSASFTMGCTPNENCGNIPVYKNVSKMSNGLLLEECEECCGVDKCNKDLCKYRKPPPCSDQRDDCSYWNKNFNICEHIHEAKKSCRKFCKLCDLVDGNWADWSSWSSCDVTCGHGKHTRIRTCTNPAPAYMGLNCTGSNMDTKPCIRPLCPVHGGWAGWSSWDSCPVTCDIGIQKRHRKCSNPSPLRHGNHCFGDPMDVRICKERPCDDSVSSVAFNAYYVTDCSPEINQRMVFSKVLLNDGDAYNNSTGRFIAPRNGTYSFEAQMCINYQRNMHFDIMVRDTVYASAYGYDYYSRECSSAYAITRLNKGDMVFVQWKSYSYAIYNAIPQNNIYRNSFTGKISNP